MCGCVSLCHSNLVIHAWLQPDILWIIAVITWEECNSLRLILSCSPLWCLTCDFHTHGRRRSSVMALVWRKPVIVIERECFQKHAYKFVSMFHSAPPDPRTKKRNEMDEKEVQRRRRRNVNLLPHRAEVLFRGRRNIWDCWCGQDQTCVLCCSFHSTGVKQSTDFLLLTLIDRDIWKIHLQSPLSCLTGQHFLPGLRSVGFLTTKYLAANLVGLSLEI